MKLDPNCMSKKDFTQLLGEFLAEQSQEYERRLQSAESYDKKNQEYPMHVIAPDISLYGFHAWLVKGGE